jgi:Zn-dependent protease
VNTRNLGHPRRDFMLVAAAGPISNLLQAIVAAILLRILMAGGAVSAMPFDLLYLAIQINLLLAFFNLIPVPPLDGGNVLMGLLPPRVAAGYYQLRQYGFLLLYAMMLTGIASAIVVPPTRALMRILLP